MSCIPKILELKGDKRILPVPSKKDPNQNIGLVIEDGGNYKGYDYLITFNELGVRCGYVALPPTHPVNNFYNENYNVHGGVTFFGENHLSACFFGDKACNDKWLGFDCGHGGDLNDYDTALNYFADDERTLKNINAMLEIKCKVANEMEEKYPGFKERRKLDLFNEKERTCDYVISECKRLIDQLITEEAE